MTAVQMDARIDSRHIKSHQFNPFSEMNSQMCQKVVLQKDL